MKRVFSNTVNSILLVGLCVFFHTVHANGIVLIPEQQNYVLYRSLYVLEDISNSMTIQEVIRRDSDGEFQSGNRETIPFGLTSSAYWFRFTVNNPQNLQHGWLLELSYPLIDHADFFSLGPDGDLEKVTTGDHYPMSSRDLFKRNFVFQLPEPLPENYTAYLRLQTEGTLIVPLTLWSAQSFEQKEAHTLHLLGWYYGTILAMVCYNLLLFVSIRESGYLFYVCYLSATLLLQLSLQGLTFQYLWPDTPLWGNQAVLFFLSLTIYFAIAFTRSFLYSKTQFPRVDKYMSVLAWLTLLSLVLVFVMPYWLSVRFVIALDVIVSLAILWAYCVGVYKGYKSAIFMLLAYAILYPGAVAPLLYHSGVIENEFIGNNLLKIGTALHAILLSLGLADRINTLTKDKAQAKSDLLASKELALEMQQNFSKRLIENQEAEKRHIASELHDGLGQNLLLMVNKLKQYLKKSDGYDQHRQQVLREVMDIASDSVQEARDISHNIHPHILELLGLKKAIESTTRRILRGSGIACNLQVDDIFSACPESIHIHIYRVIQEAINNVIRHSSASNCWVSACLEDNCIDIQVKDDGIGIRHEICDNPQTSNGLGLSGIAERVKIIGGKYSITSESGKGSSLSVSVPVGQQCV